MAKIHISKTIKFILDKANKELSPKEIINNYNVGLKRKERFVQFEEKK